MKADHFYYPALFSGAAIAAGLLLFLFELLFQGNICDKNEKTIPSMHIPILHKNTDNIP